MNRNRILASSFSAFAISLVAVTAVADVRHIDAMDLSGSYNGGGMRTGVRQSVCGTPLSVAGKIYERGLGMRAEGAVGFRLDGRATAFDALVGVDDCAKGMKHGYRQVRVIFKVWTDGVIVWTSPTLGEKSLPVAVHVDLAGVRELYLETSSAAPWVAFDACAGDWLDARITAADDAKVEPIADPDAIRQLGILTPPEKAEPRINGADILGVRPGHPVIFRVATSGERPMRFTAKGVPEGVTFDAAKGILGGIAPQRKGDYDIEVTAENAKGKATRTIRLAVGDTIALTPPMGWNSWNIWGENFNGEHAMAATRALDASGLGDHGWAYVNLDDFWEMNNSPQNKDRPELRGPARDAEGRILPNPSFPDMRKLTDYIHSFGFRAGLYSSPGPTTCGGCEGSYGHELQDAARWAEWGFDYVKYDWCSYDEVIKDERGGKAWHDDDNWRDVRCDSKERPYRLMKDCLLKQNRDIVYSFCQYGMGHAEEWARDAGANCWRCWEDLKDTWPWMEKALESRIGAENYWKYVGPGCWVDPDMLIVGDQNAFGFRHPTLLTPNEQYTHVSLWCMLGAPLLIGCDLTNLDAFTRNLLANDEVIAVNQDRLGKIARRLRHTDAEDVWMRPLSGNFVAIALVNRSPFTREIRVDFKELGLGGERLVKDLWRQECEGRHYGFYSAVVPPHATKLVKSCPADCPKCDDAATRPPRTFCNPMSIPDMPVGIECRDFANGTPVPLEPAWRKRMWADRETTMQYRELADPTVRVEGDRWYLYPSCALMWTSDDCGGTWRHIPVGGETPYAPDIIRFRGKYYMATSHGPLSVSDSPTGPFRELGHFDKASFGDDPQMPVPAGDPAFFTEDGRLYLYWGVCNPPKSIWGAELDPENPLKAKAPARCLLTYDKEKFPWHGANEGSWMFKRNGTYYLFYSGRGTHDPLYDISAMKSKSPLGPFVHQKNSPFFLSPTGLVTGTGHCSVFEDARGDIWAIYCILVGTYHSFERMIGMDRLTIDANGDFVSARATDTPQWLPSSGKKGDTGWKALPARCVAPECCDGNLKTFHVFGAAPVTLEYDFSGERTLCAFRLIWRDYGLDTKRGVMPGPYKYSIERRENGDWKPWVDRSQNETDLMVDYREGPEQKGDAVRLVVTGCPKGMTTAITEFTVFGF